jgi:hypothetical protein
MIGSLSPLPLLIRDLADWNAVNERSGLLVEIDTMLEGVDHEEFRRDISDDPIFSLRKVDTIKEIAWIG